MNALLQSIALSALLASPIAAQRAELPRTRKPTPTTAAISVADIMTREYIIADDSMEGRNTGRRGGLKAAQYIANELKRLGVEPAGDNGTYFQAIPWVSQAPDEANALRIGTTALTSDDFIMLPRIGQAVQIGGQPFGRAFRGESVASVFGGVIGDTNTISVDAARGKVVVFAAPAQTAQTGGRGGGRGGGAQFWTRDNLRRYREARAILVAIPPQSFQQYRAPRETYDDTLATGAATPLSVIAISVAAADQMFGKPIATVSVGTGGPSVSGSVRFKNTPTEAPAYNVAGIIRGRDAKLRSTYVSIGMHHDHVGMGPVVDHDSIRAVGAVVRKLGGDEADPTRRQGAVTDAQWAKIRTIIDSLHKQHGGPRADSVFNGADDDGSGSVLGLELAEAFAAPANRPAHSLLFVFHTAEEKGLYGAQYYSDHPTVPRDSIIAQVNLDQMGRGDAEDEPPSGLDALVLIGSRRTSTELGDLVEKVNTKPGFGFKLDYTFDKPGDPNSGWCRSDHYMYARYGVPVVFFVSAVSYQDLHMVTDEPQYIAYDRMTKIGRYLQDFVSSLANLDHRPVIDKPKPDPNGRCVQ